VVRNLKAWDWVGVLGWGVRGGDNLGEHCRFGMGAISIAGWGRERGVVIEYLVHRTSSRSGVEKGGKHTSLLVPRLREWQ
jgi:hypothetical protein